MQEKDLDRVCELTDEVYDKISEIKKIYRTLGEALEEQFIQRMRDRFDGPYEN